MSSLYALLKVCNQLIDKADSKEMLTMLTHAVVLLLSANRQLNLSRRELLRPHLNKNYQALCNPAVPITTNLFGDDLNKQVDDLTKANKIGLKVQGFGQATFSPIWAWLACSWQIQTKLWWAWSLFNCNRRKRFFFRLRPGRILPQTSQIEAEVTNIIANQRVFVGGQVQYFVSQWKALMSDPKILDIISHCHIEFGEFPTQKGWSAVTHLENKFSDQERVIIDAQVAEFLSKGILSYSESQDDQIISPIFFRPKPDGTYRVIFNLKALNDSVVYHHFKLDTLEATLPLITPGCYMTSLDLKDAYYSIPIAPEHQRFLKFIWKGVLYQFRCRPPVYLQRR